MLSNKICVQLNKEEGTIDLKLGRLVDCFPASDILFWVHSVVSLFILGRPIPWSHCGRNCQDWEVRDQLLSVTTKEHLRFLLLAMSRRWPNFLSTCDFLGSCAVGGTRMRNLRWKFSKPDFSFCRGIWKSKLTTVVAAAALIPNKTVYPIWKFGSERDLSRAATTCQSATSQLF